PGSATSRGKVFLADDNGRPDDRATKPAGSTPVLAEVVPIQSFDQDSSQWLNMPRRPMAALTVGDWTYIRREVDVREELYHLREDAQQRHNRVGDPGLQPMLERMRGMLGRLTAGPLTSQRFNP